MGSHKTPLSYSNESASSDPKLLTEPEEYVLDTYILPINSEIQNAQDTSPDLVKNSRLVIKKAKGLKKSQLSSRAYPNYIGEDPHDVSSSNLKHKSGSTKERTLLSSTGDSSKKVKPNFLRYGEASSRAKVDSIIENQRVGYREISHDDSADSTCFASHINDKKECKRRNRNRPPQDIYAEPSMGDVDNTKFGKSQTRRTRGHKVPFFKTVSIIDTLSELGPDVKHLAEEPSPDTVQSSKASFVHHKESKTTSSVLFSLEPTGVKCNTGPPCFSSDFQQYTEKIYDAVTRLSTTNQAARHKTPKERLSKVPQEKRNKLATYLNTRVKDETNCKQDSASHSKKHRKSRQKGRTPEWIKKIFDVAKKGDLEAIKQVIMDMEETLVRNLNDHCGNNLLHVMSVFGHLTPMTWLLATHALLVDAFYDENKYGLTPVVCSIKYGRIHILQWLVENTIVREKVKSKEGERSLLHIAAKYAQEEIVSWLVDYMMTNEVSLDNTDHHGNTSLHLASRSGNSRLCSILLQHGADVTLKNDLGQKAWEVCVIRGHLACAEYLCVHESGLALATDLTRTEAELETAMTDNHDLRINFKEVMNMARRLIREREDVMRELSRLQDQMAKTYGCVADLHLNTEDGHGNHLGHDTENQSQYQRQYAEALTTQVKSLYDKWQALQKTWFGSSLVNTKHKMLLLEEAWKKLRQRNHRTVATTHHPLDVFRGKLCAIRSQGGEGKFGDLPSLCSSEESLVSSFPFSEDEEIMEKEYKYEIISSSTPAKRANVPCIYGLNDDSYSKIHNFKTNYFNDVSIIGHNGASEVLLHKEIENNYIRETREISGKYSKSSTPKDKYYSSINEESYSIPSETMLSGDKSCINELNGGDILHKEDINTRLKELALTSESGSCSVLEVIEPSSEESDSQQNDEKLFLQRNKTHEESRNHITRVFQNSRGKHFKNPSRKINKNPYDYNDEYTTEITTSSESGAECVSNRSYNSGKNSIEKPFLVSETSPDSAAVDVSENKQRSHEYNLADGKSEQNYDMGTTVGLPLPHSHLSTDLNGGTFKRRGFLHKLINPNVWTAKIKVKTLKKSTSSTNPEYQDPLDCNVSSNSLNHDSENNIYPSESNTASSQEYNNSIEPSLVNPSVSNLLSNPTEFFPCNVTNTLTDEIVDNHCMINVQESILSSGKMSPHIFPLPPIDSSCPLTPPPLPTPRTTIISSVTSEPQSISLSCDIDEERILNKETIVSKSERFPYISEDSRILARPASSASKSESISRPDSSSSSFPAFKTAYSLRKSSISLTQDMLPTPDSSLTGRMSPAPSEVSKTESALSPPSHLSDVSKSESSRQTSLGSNNNSNNSSKNGSTLSNDYSSTSQPIKKEDLTVKTANIINITSETNTVMSLQEEPPEITTGDLTCHKKERPWYEISDEETDILLPDRLTSKMIFRHSSSEDEAAVC